MGILNRKIPYVELLKNLLLLPPIIISSYTLDKNRELKSINEKLEKLITTKN